MSVLVLESSSPSLSTRAMTPFFRSCNLAPFKTVAPLPWIFWCFWGLIFCALNLISSASFLCSFKESGGWIAVPNLVSDEIGNGLLGLRTLIWFSRFCNFASGLLKSVSSAFFFVSRKESSGHIPSPDSKSYHPFSLTNHIDFHLSDPSSHEFCLDDKSGNPAMDELSANKCFDSAMQYWKCYWPVRNSLPFDRDCQKKKNKKKNLPSTSWDQPTSTAPMDKIRSSGNEIRAPRQSRFNERCRSYMMGSADEQSWGEPSTASAGSGNFSVILSLMQGKTPEQILRSMERPERIEYFTLDIIMEDVDDVFYVPPPSTDKPVCSPTGIQAFKKIFSLVD